jgi:hypothetical protein
MGRILLNQNWELYRFDISDHRTWEDIIKNITISRGRESACYAIRKFPMQVHDVLLDHGVIEDPNIKGYNPYEWIDEFDWVYCCRFRVDEITTKSLLEIDGMDTFADVYLNGHLLKKCEDAFLNYQIDTSSLVYEENTLVLYFHSAKERVEKINVPEVYKASVSKISMARVFRTGFHEYCGPIPSLIRCGVYGNITLVQTDKVVIRDWTIGTSLSEDLHTGYVHIETLFDGELNQFNWSVCISDRSGKEILRERNIIQHAIVSLDFEIPNPSLWFPRNYGDANLYKICISIEGELDERKEKLIGFRRISIESDFHIKINNHPVKLWGANLAHPDTRTNCYNRDKMNSLLDWAERGNFNILRVWGESEIYPEEFYEECDRRGLLIWQDFYLCNAMYPENPEYLELCRQEAAQLVNRLKNHPSILLWCGGNELFLARDYSDINSKCFGEKIVKEVFSKVCNTLDPERFYCISSPYGGVWSNDPSVGDTHGYTHLWYVPGRIFPHFLSENCRVSVPELRTLKLMMEPDEIWPQDYTGKVTRSSPLKWPKTWSRHNTNEGHLKLGPVEHYYDPENIHELIYNINAAYAEYIHNEVGRFRRGYCGADSRRTRITQGHMLWRLNNNSNIISYGVIDYLGEPNYSYYELKRCYEPFLVSCELSNHGYIWATNDTVQEIKGTIVVRLFNMKDNSVQKEIQANFEIAPDQSLAVTTLDEWGQFRKENVIHIQAFSAEGCLLSTWYEYADIERNLQFPTETGLSIWQEKEHLFITCNKFARCVKLTGCDAGDEFNWIFDDNYFDLMPGIMKKVKVDGRHVQGIIRAKAEYDDTVAECKYVKSE